MKDMEDIMAEDARLVILRDLARQADGRLNETLVAKRLDAFGYNRSRQWPPQLNKLAELGAVRLASIHRPELDPLSVATITRTGLDHVERRHAIEGVARPSPGG